MPAVASSVRGVARGPVGVMLFTLLLLSTSQRVIPTLASSIIREHLRLSGSEFGVLAGIAALAYGLAQLPGGHLSDVHGPVPVAKVAALVSAAGTAVFVLAPSYPIALAGRTVFGVADSVLFMSLMRFVVGTRSQGGALQIGKVQATVGAAFAGVALIALGLTATSFALVFGALALVQVAIAFTLSAPATERPRPHAARSLPSLSQVAEVARTRQFWAAVLANTGLFAPFLAWTGAWAVPYLVSVCGLHADQARLVVVADGIAGAGGAMALGRLSDVLHRRRRLILLGSAAMTAAWGAVLAFGSSSATGTVLMSLVACVMFPASSSSLALAKESFRADRAGMVLGLSNMASSITAAALGAAIGLALDAGWAGAYEHGIRLYPRSAYVAVPVILLLGSVLALVGGLLARETYARQAAVPGAA